MRTNTSVNNLRKIMIICKPIKEVKTHFSYIFKRIMNEVELCYLTCDLPLKMS